LTSDTPEPLSINASLRKLLTWFLSPRSLVLEQDGEHRPVEIAEHFAISYAYVQPKKVHEASWAVKEVEPIATTYFNEDALYREPIKKICELVNGQMGSLLSFFCLHGSLATEDYKKRLE